MMFWMLSGVLALHLSDGTIDYRTVRLETCYNIEWAYNAENENPDTRLVDAIDVGDAYITGATCFAAEPLPTDPSEDAH